MVETQKIRPIITEIADPAEILRQMLLYRRQTEASFSVMRACQRLLRISPALVSLVVKGQRPMTPERVDEFSKLMKLTGAEKIYLKGLVGISYGEEKPPENQKTPTLRSRKDVSHHILSDWINLYVKDCFHIIEIQKKPELIYNHLGTLASRKRLERSYKFLLSEGYLRRTPDGRIVIETNLSIADSHIPSAKVRAFHKAALKVGQQSLDLCSHTERLSNTLLVCLSQNRFEELVQMTQEFSEKLKEFAEEASPEDDRLYQLVINISPVGAGVQ